MSVIDSIVEYVGSLDPMFPSAIEGASLSEVDLLAELSGRALPGDYRDFLLRMGRSMDWVDLPGTKFGIDTVLEFYRRPAWTVPANSQWIARTMHEAAYDIYLTSGRVVSFAPPEPDASVDTTYLTPVAGSLAELIGTRAFRTVRMNTCSQGWRLYQRRPLNDSPEAAARALAPLGFSSLWFSTDWGFVCEADGAGAVAMKGPNSVLVVDCAATDPGFLKEAGARLQAELGMVESKAPDIWRRG